MIWGLSRDCTIEFFLPPWNSNTTSRLHQTSLFYDTLQLLSFNDFAKQKKTIYICTFPDPFLFFIRNWFIFSFFFFSKIVARVPNFFLLGEKSSASALFQRPQHPVRYRADRRIDRPTTKKRSRGDKGGGGVQSDRRGKSGSRLRPSGEATVRYKEAKRNRRAATATATVAGCCNNASTAATAATAATATENTFSAREMRRQVPATAF